MAPCKTRKSLLTMLNYKLLNLNLNLKLQMKKDLIELLLPPGCRMASSVRLSPGQDVSDGRRRGLEGGRRGRL